MTTLAAGKPTPLGASYDGKGVNFTLFSAHAERVELCVFDQQGNERRYDLPGAQRRYLARLAGRCASGATLRLSGARAVGSGAGASLQSGQAAARPLRASGGGRTAGRRASAWRYV